jgi:hypothetical protein
VECFEGFLEVVRGELFGSEFLLRERD